MFCRKCGTQIPNDSEFCPKCGTRVELDSVSSAPVSDAEERVFAGVKCQKCGEIIPSGNMFCPSCGENLPKGAPLTRATSSSGSSGARSYAASRGVKCQKCGKIIPSGNMFCPSCGENLPKSEQLTRETQSKGRSKKGLFIWLGIAVAVFCAIFIPIQVANYKEAHHEFEYLFDGGFAVIYGYNGDGTDVIIPDTIKKVPVKVIVGSAFKNSNITSLELNEGLEIIGPSAFEDCKYLETVTMRGESILSSIGERAFSGCASLRSIDIEVADQNIETGDYVFAGCESLTSLPSFMSKLYPLGEGAFENCTGLTEIRIGRSVIPDRCFAGCTSLESVYIWNYGGKIGTEAFENCKSLETVITYREKNSVYTTVHKYPSSLTSSGFTVGIAAFDGCEKFDISNYMLPYTFNDFYNKHIGEVEKMLGVKYTLTGDLTYSCEGYPTFRVLGEWFGSMPVAPEIADIVVTMDFTNQNIWMTSGGYATDKVRLGMTYDEIISIVSKDSKCYYVRDGDELRIYDDFYGFGPVVYIDLNSNDVAYHCHIYHDMP